MRRHFSSSRRSRRRGSALEANVHPQVTHLHVASPSAISNLPARGASPLASELAQLRARLLQMIVANESTRRATKTLS